MKLIIDIPEHVYKKAKETHDVMCDSVWIGIKYATPFDSIKAEIRKHCERYMDGDIIAEEVIQAIDSIGKGVSE